MDAAVAAMVFSRSDEKKRMELEFCFCFFCVNPDWLSKSFVKDSAQASFMSLISTSN